MSGYLRSIFIVFIFLFICAYQSMAGLIVERERYEKGGGERVSGTIYIQENKLKFFDEEGQFYAIFDLNTGEMIQVDNLSRTYSTTRADDYFAYYKQYAQRMEAAMRQQLSELPPNKREQAEAMMKRQGIALPGSNGKSSDISSKKTSDTKKIAGYESVKYEIYVDGRLEEEIWITSDERFKQEVDIEKMTQYLSELRAIDHSLGGNGNSDAKAYVEVFSSGFPMKTIDYPVYGNEIIEQTVKVSNKNIDNNEFTAPLGYRKVELKEMLQLTN
ncbi:MAG: DUF4412 domain-containing protein [Chloroflexota bacterium]